MKRGGFIFLKSCIIVICLFLLPVAEAFAEDYGALDVGIGYRTDDINWNIAGNLAGESPNVLSELTWDDLQILQIETAVKASIRRVYVRGLFDYGWILAGDNQDSDYFGDNRTLEFSRSNNDAGDGQVFDASIGIGYTVIDKKFKLTPLAGYSYHNQKLYATEGFQTIPPLGPFPGLKSTYKSEWYGPWLGVDVSHQFSKKFSMSGTFEYHWADYEGEGNWNLRTDLAHPVSFKHDADGDGIVAAVNAVYTPKGIWPITVEVKYQDWSTDPGIDTVFAASGATAQTRLNEVNWESLSIMIKASYYFY